MLFGIGFVWVYIAASGKMVYERIAETFKLPSRCGLQSFPTPFIYLLCQRHWIDICAPSHCDYSSGGGYLLGFDIHLSETWQRVLPQDCEPARIAGGAGSIGASPPDLGYYS